MIITATDNHNSNPQESQICSVLVILQLDYHYDDLVCFRCVALVTLNIFIWQEHHACVILKKKGITTGFFSFPIYLISLCELKLESIPSS